MDQARTTAREVAGLAWRGLPVVVAGLAGVWLAQDRPAAVAGAIIVGAWLLVYLPLAETVRTQWRWWSRP